MAIDDLFLQGAIAGIDAVGLEAFSRSLNEGTIFDSPSLSPVVDSEGDPLVAEQIYTRPDGKRFRVTKWRFGSGNILLVMGHWGGFANPAADS